MRWFALGAALLLSATAAQLSASASSSAAAASPTAVSGSQALSATGSSAVVLSATALSATATATNAVALSTTPLAQPSAKSDGATLVSPTAAPAAAFQPPHRSPALASSLAFFPGVALHGIGHMYAGSWMKGLGLFAIEGGVGYLGYSAYNEYQRGAYSGLKFSGGQIPNLGGAESEVGILLVAAGAFIFTWVDDMAGAPIAAAEFNKIHAHDQGLSVRLEPVQNGALLALTSTF